MIRKGAITALLCTLSLLLGACSLKPPLSNRANHAPTPSTLIIVHGLYADANHVQPLTKGLTSQGFTCLAPNLQPNDGSVAIESLAHQLGTFIEKNVPPNTPLQLIGHSMGGLVALHYLQDHKNASRCRGLYTIATPHHGTLLANLHFGTAGRQMVTDSPFLKGLHSRRPPFPIVTYRSSQDFIIIPSSSSILSFAEENKVITSPGHNEILQTNELLRSLLSKINQHD